MLRLSKRGVKLTCRVGLNLIFLVLSKQALAQAVEDIVVSNERSINVPLPEWTTRQNDATIATELDGYDISPFTSINGNMLELRLETPLSPGKHSLNVSLFLPDGEIESLVYEDLYIEGAAEHAGNWRINSTFSSSYLAGHDDNRSYRDRSRYSGNAALTVQGEQQSGDWTVSADAQAIYDSNKENNPDLKHWVLPEYHLNSAYRGSAGRASIGAGNINFEQESLLFSSFQRRGATADMITDSERYRLRFFGVQPEPATTMDRDLVTSSEDIEQNVGMTAGANLLDQHLMLNVGYIGGETRLGSSNLYALDEPTLYGGDSWNMAVDSIWMNNSLWLHLEYAQSKFDIDGIGIGRDEERDSAHQLVLQLSSEGEFGSGWFDYWSASLQRKSVGYAFYSLGNLNLPGDSELSRLHLQGAHGGLSLEAELAREESNIDNRPFMPTQTHDNTGITLNFIPMNLNPDSRIWRLLGSPGLTYRYNRTHHYQLDSDALLVGYDLDNRVDESELSLKFDHPSWNWGLQYQLVDQVELSHEVVSDGFLLYQPASDQRNALTALQLGWNPNQRLSLNLQLQWNKRDELDLNNIYRSRNLGLDASFQLVPETLMLQLGYNYSGTQSRLRDEFMPDEDYISQTANTQLTWHALKAKGSGPAMDLFFRGGYGKQDNRTYAQVDEQWSTHIGFNMHWGAGGQE